MLSFVASGPTQHFFPLDFLFLGPQPPVRVNLNCSVCVCDSSFFVPPTFDQGDFFFYRNSWHPRFRPSVAIPTPGPFFPFYSWFNALDFPRVPIFSGTLPFTPKANRPRALIVTYVFLRSFLLRSFKWHCCNTPSDSLFSPVMVTLIPFLLEVWHTFSPQRRRRPLTGLRDCPLALAPLISTPVLLRIVFFLSNISGTFPPPQTSFLCDFFC